MGPSALASEQRKASSSVFHILLLSESTRLVLIYMMINLASTNTQKRGTRGGAGGWQERWWPIVELGIHAHCNSSVPAFEGINLPAGSLNSHRGFSPFPFFAPKQTSQLCCRGISPSLQL